MIFIVFFISVILFSLNLFYLIKLNFEGPGLSSDQGKHINSVKYYNFFSFNPVKMHELSFSKSSMKDANIYLLKILKFIFNNKLSDVQLYALFVNLMFSFSSIIIYLYIEILFEERTAFIIYLLYVTSLWTYLLIFNLAVHFTAILFFFFSLYILELNISYFDINLSYLISGIFFIVFNFSSASSRKMIVSYFLLFFLYLFKINLYEFNVSTKSILNNLNFILIYFFLFSIYFFWSSKYLRKFLFKKFSSIIKKNINKNYNLKAKQIKLKIQKYLNYFNFSFFSLSLFFIALFISARNKQLFLIDFGLYFFGIIFSLLFFLYPNILQNLKFYFSYWNITKYANHFLLYRNINKNHKILIWYKKFLLHFNSTISLILLVSVILFSLNTNLSNNYLLILYLFLPLSGIIFTEFTNGIRATLSYYTIFPLLLILISFLITKSLDKNYYSNYLIYFSLMVHVFYNIYIILSDIIPSKLYNHKLRKYLKNNKIKKIYTPKLPHNVSFIETYQFHYKNDVEIVYVDKNYEFQNGDYVYLPSLNSKSVIFQSITKVQKDLETLLNEDLYKLYRDKSVENLTIKKFKNPGTSRFWQTCSEVSCFRLFCLESMKKDDFELYGYARILRF